MSRYKEMLVWSNEHETTDRAALIGTLTHGRSCNDGCQNILEDAFRAIAADLVVLATLVGSDDEEASALNPAILRLFIEGIETRARAAAGFAAREELEKRQGVPVIFDTSEAAQ